MRHFRGVGRKVLTIIRGGSEPVGADDSDVAGGMLAFSGHVGSTCDLGLQTISLTPGASSTCGGGNCSCCSSCCW
jgi:hypothetical protein